MTQKTTSSHIKFVDLVPRGQLAEQIDDAYRRVMYGGRYIGGDEIESFEEEWARYCGAEYCIAVANGFDAIRLSLKAVGVCCGDRVIVPTNTCLPTWLAVTAADAKPLGVEPDSDTYVLKAKTVKEHLHEVSAIVAVNLYGMPVRELDFHTMVEGAADLMYYISDAAQSHGARSLCAMSGAVADATAWSFYPTKNLGAIGDAGAVTTNDARTMRQVRNIANYKSANGTNSRMDVLQAAFLRVKMLWLNRWTVQRRENAAVYLSMLEDTSVTLPVVPDWADPVWHQFVIRTPRRDSLARWLKDRGIDTMVHYPIPPHLQANFGYHRGDFPIAEQLATEVLSLPIGHHLSTADIEHVGNNILEWDLQ